MSLAHAGLSDFADLEQHVAYNNFAAVQVRNLDLLRDIEQTCFALRNLADFLNALNSNFHDLASGLGRMTRALPEDKVLAPVDRILEALAVMHGRYREGLVSARSDRQLRTDDGVVDLYEDVIRRMLNTHETVSEYRCGVMLHNALLDQSGGTVLSTEKDIKDYLDSL